MEYFLHTVETVPEGLGFSHYSPIHLFWLGLLVAAAVLSVIYYRRASQKGRSCWRKTVALLAVVDEVFKQTCLIVGGRWLPEYLPLHLCSINIALILYHSFKGGNKLGNFLYMVCIPGALAALLFPTWTELPMANFMHIHSFSVHILLALYPLVLSVCGDIRPEAKNIPVCLLILLAMAAVVWFLNPLLDANFFFLAGASKGNPLYWFKENWGSHLYGFPVLVTAIVTVMFAPVELYRKLKKA